MNLRADLVQDFEIRYADCIKWRWLTDDKENWHKSYALDLLYKGKRFVIYKGGTLFPYGTDEDCDNALKCFLDEFADERNKPWKSKEVKEVDKVEIILPRMAQYEGDEYKKFWDMSRSLFREEKEMVIPQTKITLRRRSEKYEQLSLFSLI